MTESLSQGTSTGLRHFGQCRPLDALPRRPGNGGRKIARGHCGQGHVRSSIRSTESGSGGQRRIGRNRHGADRSRGSFRIPYRHRFEAAHAGEQNGLHFLGLHRAAQQSNRRQERIQSRGGHSPGRCGEKQENLRDRACGRSRSEHRVHSPGKTLGPVRSMQQIGQARIRGDGWDKNRFMPTSSLWRTTRRK